MNSLIIFGAKYLIMIIILIAAAFFLSLSREKRKEMVVFAIIILPVIYAIAKITSLFYYDMRPFVSGNFVPLIAHANDNGFPSDHVLLSTAVAATVYFVNKKWGVFLFFLSFLIGTARVLTGVHHAIDIAGSFAITIAVSLLSYKFIFPAVLKSKLLEKIEKLFSK